MIRPTTHKWSILARRVAFCSVVFVLGSRAEQVGAVGLNYVDANDFTNLTPTSAIDSFASTAEPDNLWDIRTDFGLGLTVFQSINEDSPLLTQMITGLTPGVSYDVYAVFQTDAASPPGALENWLMSTGLTPGNLTQYSFRGGPVGPATAMVNSTQGITAGAAVWDTLPPTNKEGTVFTERPADALVVLLGKAGTAMADASGQINVLVDDLAASNRTWLEGVAYVDAGTPIALTTTLDRATGAITITNPTATPFQIKSYSIESTSGALDATAWTQVAGWDVMTTPDPAAPFSTLLSQTDPTGTGTTIAANGGSISFGSIWNASPFEDVLIRLTRADDEIAVILPQYSGTAVAAGDFNASGSINLEDFQVLLTNLHTNVSALSVVDTFQRGDMNADRVINFSDFVAFRTAYDAANGAGSFASLVPEPSTCGMLLMLIAALSVSTRRRVIVPALVVALIWMGAGVSQSALALEIKVDIDSMRTSGTATAGPFVTQSGFTSWDLTNLGTAGATTTVDGVMFEIFGMAGVNQSRVRVNTDGTLNGGGGEFNDLLADFVFNEGADTRAIGLRITNLPVGTYMMQSWHADYGVTAAEATQVEIRNQGDPIDPSQIVVPATPWSDLPLEYPLEITTPGQVREVIFRESSTTNRARLNGFTIVGDAVAPTPIELTLQVNTTTGAVSIRNEQSVSFDMSYYEIRSPSGALSPAGWTSLEDAEGNDPVGTGWDEATASSANILNEVNLTSMSGYAPGSVSALGNAFMAGGMEDLVFRYAGPTESILRTGIIKYVTGPTVIVGDYNANGTVDAADYILWRKHSSTSTPLPNDTTPGTVDQSDYLVWRTNFGRTAGSGAGLAAGTAVPEPATLWLLGFAILLANLAAGLAPRGRM